MIFKHKRTGKLYKKLLESFDTERQEHHVVYLQIDTGYIFNREKTIFANNFECMDAMPQCEIIPHNPDRKKQ